MSAASPPLIYSIGHSDHELDVLIGLLKRHGIETVVDVRSHPYSRWVPQANRETLARALQEAGLTYLFMGEALGGRPPDRALYDKDEGEERPNYQRMTETPAFQDGLERLVALAGSGTVVMMCSEGDYRRCHRTLLITPSLLEREARVIHILPDGTTVEAHPEPKQLSLF